MLPSLPSCPLARRARGVCAASPFALSLLLALLSGTAAAQQAGAPPAAPPEEATAEAPEAAPDEPPRPEGLLLRSDEAFDGYTLIAPLNSLSIHLVDMDGEVVHTWETRHVPGAATYLLPGGDLLRCGQVRDNPRFRGGGLGGVIERIAWDGSVVWRHELAGDHRTLHHDIELLPNGNLLAIAWEFHSREEVLAAGRDPRFIHEDGLWSDTLLEIRPTLPEGGEIVWTWRSWDHLVQDFDPRRPRFGAPSEHPGRIDINADVKLLPQTAESDEERERRLETEEQMRALGYVGGEPDPPGADDGPSLNADWLHTNAVAYHPELQLIVLSTPRLDEVWILDHSTTTEEAAGNRGGRRGRGGELLWRWGNPQAWGAGTPADQQLFAQHDPTWVHDAPASLPRLLVFDNGSGRPDGAEFSAVLELVLPFDPERGFLRETGKAFGPAEAVWRYVDPPGFWSAFISGAQRLPNGNTLICEGRDGRVFEVTRDGRIVWDFWNPLGGEVEPSEQGGRAPPKALFRAQRVPRDHPGLAERLPPR